MYRVRDLQDATFGADAEPRRPTLRSCTATPDRLTSEYSRSNVIVPRHLVDSVGMSNKCNYEVTPRIAQFNENVARL